MSSWKNAHKAYQKPHRERHQPEGRKHLGILEKKKDYKLRANDYNEKKNELKRLELKALTKNPDEFYYHMINSQIEDGEHHEKSKSIDFTPEQLKLMQTQDFKYISNKRTVEFKKIQKLQASLHKLEDSEIPKNKHTIFVDDEKDIKNFHLTEKFGTSKDLLRRRYNRLGIDQLTQVKIYSKYNQGSKEENLQKIIQDKKRSYKLLEERQKRLLKLSRLQGKMELKRALQDKKREIKRRIEPAHVDAPPIYEFKQERKR